ncbi:unnamed protein product, partial [Polarella glacialis]
MTLANVHPAWLPAGQGPLLQVKLLQTGPRNRREGRLVGLRSGLKSLRRLKTTTRRQGVQPTEELEVVALLPAPVRRTLRRLLLLASHGATAAFAASGRWNLGWVMPVGSVGLHLLLAGLLGTRPSLRQRLDFRRSTQPAAGGWVSLRPCGSTGTSVVLRQPWSYAQSLLVRYHGQRYELLQVDAGLRALAILPLQETLNALHERLKEGGLSDAVVSDRRQRFGNNDYCIPVPPLRRLILLRLLRPIAIFELASVLIWALDDYWQFTLLTLLSILGFEIGAAVTRHKSLLQLREAAAAPHEVAVLRDGTWQSLGAGDLLPGDIFQVRQGLKLACDAVLLQGSATAGEAALTGESAPVPKSPSLAEVRPVDDVDDARHCLFAGTEVLAVQGEVVAAAMRTGFHSKQGVLMRRALAAQDSIRDRDTLKIVLLLLAFAAVAALQVLVLGSPGQRSWVKAGVILSFVVQPSLPLLMTFAVQRTLQVLRTKEVVCAEPLRVLEAGLVSQCLFDKTGTLTSDRLEAAGVLLPSSRGELVSMAQVSTDTAGQ